MSNLTDERGNAIISLVKSNLTDIIPPARVTLESVKRMSSPW